MASRLSVILLSALGAAGCPTVDPGETPVMPGACRPDPSEFQAPGGIWDVAIDPAAAPDRSCIAAMGCHAQADGRSSLRLVARPRDQLTTFEWQQNYDVVTRFLNCSTPQASPFITKPQTGRDPHGGGDLWPDCAGGACDPVPTVEQWIGGS